MKYLFLLICLGIINSEVVKQSSTLKNINNEKMQTQPDRQLWGGMYGAYHPFYNPTLSQYAVNHQVHPTHSESTHVQKHVVPHNPYLGAYGMDPYMGMMGGMMNPMLNPMMNPMMMGMMNPMMMGMMNPMMMGMMNPMMNPMMMGGMYGMMGHGMTHTTTEQEVNSPKNEGSE